MQKVISFKIHKGPKFALEIAKEETDLTADMIASGAWKTATFKPYNFNALGADQNAGALHPLNKVRQEFRQIFFEMGFEEMPTSQFVESGFWNFDTLFVPQQHPARDLQDTFYISDPKVAGKPGPTSPDDKRDYNEVWENVRQVHENGKFGSVGYRYPWSADESLRLVLRTHTTSVSAAMLHKLAGQRDRDGRVPSARYFSIDRVFRNETVDATHLAEFHQVEGVIADYGLTLGGLMEFMEIFFGKMGLTDLSFKPAYNPYTEPSMEIFAFHKGLNKLVEIGNSGMFRPEFLESVGLPSDLRVYGWGLSLGMLISVYLVVWEILTSDRTPNHDQVRHLQYSRAFGSQGGSQLHREESGGAVRQGLEQCKKIHDHSIHQFCRSPMANMRIREGGQMRIVPSEVGVSMKLWGWRLAQDSALQDHNRNIWIKTKPVYQTPKSSDVRPVVFAWAINHLGGMTLLLRNEMKIQIHRLTPAGTTSGAGH